MNYADIEVGKIYGVREGRASLTDRPVHKVKVVAKLEERKRPKVRYLEGEREGLEEFVRTSQFLAKWGDVKRLLRDEASLEALRKANDGVINDVVWDAISAVVFSTGENVIVPMESPHRVEIPISDTERIQERFKLDPLESSHSAAFIDRLGILHLPFEVAERVAKQVAQQEPQAVPLYLRQHEEELLASGYQPGMRHRHSLLRDYQPAYALARQWAGFQGEAELLTREIERLRGILIQTAWTLKQNGADTEARRLERALNGGEG